MTFKYFKHLNVPESWERYWSKYPQGMTILESLFEWVSQVDSMVDNQNKLNDNVAQFRNEIDAFIARFDGRLQDEVTQTLTDWQNSGFLDVVISSALQWQLDDYIETNEQDKLSLISQMQHTIKVLNVSEFGAIGDGVTDDTLALKQAVSFAQENNQPIQLNGVHYVTETIDFSNIPYVYGRGKFPSSRIRYDHRTYEGNIVGTGWFMDNPPPYSFLVENLNGYDVITSDVANPIISCNDGFTEFDGVNIIGWLANETQVGFKDRTIATTVYNGTIKDIKNSSFLYCGSHGVHLKRGIEYLNWEHVECTGNGGHGLYVENTVYNHPCEYSTFKHLRVDSNYLEGVHLIGYHKNITFDTCNLSRSGQYHLPSTVRFDRSIPSDYADVKKGIVVEAYNGINGNNLYFVNCFGEEAQGLFEVRSTSERGFINNVYALNNGVMALQRNASEQALTKAVLTIKGTYMNGIEVVNSSIAFGGYAVYNLNSGVSNFKISGYIRKTFGITTDMIPPISDHIVLKDAKIKDESALLRRSFGTNSVAWTDTFDISGLFEGGSNTKGVYVLPLILNANWQVNNNNKQGTYLVTVQKGLDNTYKLNYLGMNSVTGFTTPPEIDATTGIITINLDAFYHYSLMRLGNNSYIDFTW